MTKIAIPVKNDLLSRNINSFVYFLIYEIRDKKIVGKKIDFFHHNIRGKITQWTEWSAITDIIVHDIDEDSLEMLSSTKINIFVGVKINTPDMLVADFLDGTLKSDTHNVIEKCMKSYLIPNQGFKSNT